VKRFLFAAAMALLTPALKAIDRAVDVQVVAAVLWAEARGEGQRGIEAVAEVIRNRTLGRWASTPYEVVTQAWQFSCLNGTTPAKVVAQARASVGADRIAWNHCVKVARLLVTKRFAGSYTVGATYFCTTPLDDRYVFCAKIGNHYFYR
jgi:N-acetylmuramoyl-L-alanine amidase